MALEDQAKEMPAAQVYPASQPANPKSIRSQTRKVSDTAGRERWQLTAPATRTLPTENHPQDSPKARSTWQYPKTTARHGPTSEEARLLSSARHHWCPAPLRGVERERTRGFHRPGSTRKTSSTSSGPAATKPHLAPWKDRKKIPV